VTDAEETDVANISLQLGTTAAKFALINASNISRAANATAYIFTVSNMPDGNYTWSCRASNASGNTTLALTNRTFYVDTAKPVITLNNSAILANGFNTTALNITFNWTATDNLALAFYCNFTLDGKVNNTGGNTSGILVSSGALVNVDILDIPDGTHYWNVTCWDPTNATSNRNTSETRRFTVDNVKPSNIAPNTANNTNFSSSTVTINWTATDATSSVVNCSLVVDGVRNLTGLYTASPTGATVTSQSVLGLSGEWHTWYVNCTDMAGNANTTGSLSPSMNAFYVDLTDPVPTLVLSSTSINVRATETITCSATDTRDVSSSTSFTVKLPNGLYSNDLDDSNFEDTSIIGTYTVACTATDNSGRTAIDTETFTVSSGEVSGGSSSGSSSSSTASSSTTLSVSPDVPGIVTVSNSNIAVNQVALDVSEAASGVKITVAAVNTLPSTTPASEGTVYKYVQITKTNLDDAKLSSAKIGFFVTKAWLTEKGLDSSAVELKRYTTQWISLPTIVKSSDATKVYFEATTPGFSYFAISVKEAAETPVEEAPVEEAPAEEAPVEEAPAEEAPVEPVAEKSNTWMFVLLGLVVVGVIVALVVMKKKKK
jgi:PGF-pre-PGF domain-containing protein